MSSSCHRGATRSRGRPPASLGCSWPFRFCEGGHEPLAQGSQVEASSQVPGVTSRPALGSHHVVQGRQTGHPLGHHRSTSSCHEESRNRISGSRTEPLTLWSCMTRTRRASRKPISSVGAVRHRGRKPLVGRAVACGGSRSTLLVGSRRSPTRRTYGLSCTSIREDTCSWVPSSLQTILSPGKCPGRMHFSIVMKSLPSSRSCQEICTRTSGFRNGRNGLELVPARTRSTCLADNFPLFAALLVILARNLFIRSTSRIRPAAAMREGHEP